LDCSMTDIRVNKLIDRPIYYAVLLMVIISSS
jgi:hypothetical protein